MTKLDELVKKLKEVEKEVSKMSKTALKESFEELFKAHPAIDAVSWKQYTPYFNDGDACYFRIYDYALRVSKSQLFGTTNTVSGWPISEESEEEEASDWLLHDPEEEDEYGYGVGFSESWAFRNVPELKEALEQLSAMFKAPERIFEHAFGDHVHVTVHRSGKISIQEYESHH